MTKRKPKLFQETELLNYAVRALGGRAHSTGELREKLRRRAERAEDVDVVLGRLKEIGYLDDRRFAESYATARLENQGLGKMRVLRDLRQRRVAPQLAEQATAKTYQDFGLLAEKLSEDDFRVNMGDHKAVGRDKLPPQIVKTALAMQPGQVSGLIQIENAFTIFRLNAHNPATKQPLAQVKDDLRIELQKNKYEKLRSNFAKSLRAKAKIEIV